MGGAVAIVDMSTHALLVIGILPQMTVIRSGRDLPAPFIHSTFRALGRHHAVVLTHLSKGKSTRELRKELAAMGVDCSTIFEREELERRVARERARRMDNAQEQAGESITDISLMHVQAV